MSRQILLISSVLLFASASLGGLCAPDPGPDPCETDRLGCDDGPTDWVVESCPGVEGPLEVELGTGEEAWESLDAAHVPTVHIGIQGGQHSFFGVRVPNALLADHPKLRATFWVGHGPSCVAPTEPTGEAPAACETKLGRRQVVLGAREAIHTDAKGGAEEFGILVFLVQRPVAGVPMVAGVMVEDPCGRVGMDTFTWTP